MDDIYSEANSFSKLNKKADNPFFSKMNKNDNNYLIYDSGSLT